MTRENGGAHRLEGGCLRPMTHNRSAIVATLPARFPFDAQWSTPNRDIDRRDQILGITSDPNPDEITPFHGVRADQLAALEAEGAFPGPIHLLLVGLGSGKRKGTLPATSLTALKQNLKNLGRTSWGISVSDLGTDSVEPISHHMGQTLKGSTLWISP